MSGRPKQRRAYAAAPALWPSVLCSYGLLHRMHLIRRLVIACATRKHDTLAARRPRAAAAVDRRPFISRQKNHLAGGAALGDRGVGRSRFFERERRNLDLKRSIHDPTQQVAEGSAEVRSAPVRGIAA